MAAVTPGCAAVQAIASARRSREVAVACLQDLHEHLAVSSGAAGLGHEAAGFGREMSGSPSPAAVAPPGNSDLRQSGGA